MALGYSLDFHFPDNHRFRKRGTTPLVNKRAPNMGGAYIAKEASKQSLGGEENCWRTAVKIQKTLHSGAACPIVEGAEVLRHFGRANMILCGADLQGGDGSGVAF